MSEISWHDATELVILTREQASGILSKMAEQFSDVSADVRQAFLDASQAVLEEPEIPTGS